MDNILEGGYIKFFRKILNWEWYHDTSCARVFIHCLLKSNYKDKKWQGIDIKRGQFITSIESLSTELELTPQQIRTAITKLKSTNEITSQPTNRFTIITVEKYELYQSKEELSTNEITSETTNNQQTDNKQITNNQQQHKKLRTKEPKEVNKKQEKELTLFEKALDDFFEMRIEIKAKLTEEGKTKIINKLKKMSNDEEEQIAILDQSVMNSWIGLFPLKKKFENKKETKELTDEEKRRKFTEDCQGW